MLPLKLDLWFHGCKETIWVLKRFAKSVFIEHSNVSKQGLAMLPAEWIDDLALISTVQDHILIPFFFREKGSVSCDNDCLQLLADHKRLHFFFYKQDSFSSYLVVMIVPRSVDYLAGLIPQTNPLLFPEFLCSCTLRARHKWDFAEVWNKNQPEMRQSIPKSLLSFFDFFRRQQEGKQNSGFRVLKATRNSLCCAKPNNPTEGAQTATRNCQIFHRWIQCQGGLGAQQTRGKTLKNSLKPNFWDASTWFT